MLEANKNKLFERLFSIYNRNLIKRKFNSFKIIGLDNFSSRSKNIPTIIYANHSSWWDGLIAFQITQKVDADFYVMMEEKQLKNLKLFCKLGAFSVVRENPRSAVESINYAVNTLKEKKDSVLCLFPQGEILPNNKRPIEFFHGISRIVEKIGECQVICFAMKYEFLGDFKPDIFVQIDEAIVLKKTIDFNAKEFTNQLTSILESNLDQLNNSIETEKVNKFVDLLK